MFIEDPFDASDVEAWTNFCKEMSDKLLVVGASSFASNPERIKKGIKASTKDSFFTTLAGAVNAMCNAVAVDVGEAGTFTQAMDAARVCHRDHSQHCGHDRDHDYCRRLLQPRMSWMTIR